MKLATKLIQSGAKVDLETGAITPPIHLSTTYLHSPDGVPKGGHLYQRQTNPTQGRLEEALSDCENGEAALVYASGLGAASGFFQALPHGTTVFFHRNLYYATQSLVQHFFPKWGLKFREADLTKLSSFTESVPPNSVFWVESPSNPLMEIIDLSALSKVAAQSGSQIIVDNTFATPFLQSPIALGANVVLHSATKYLGGHSDVMGGALIFKHKNQQYNQAYETRTLTGGVLSPFNAWLILRGLRTLSCRMEKHSANAMALATTLEQHPHIDKVLYPGLSSHPQHSLAKSQMDGYGGMLSILVNGGREAALKVAGRLKLFLNATSLGGTESLVEHRASVEKPPSKIPENLLRLSVGLEHEEDIIEDFCNALKVLG